MYSVVVFVRIVGFFFGVVSSLIWFLIYVFLFLILVVFVWSIRKFLVGVGLW